MLMIFIGEFHQTTHAEPNMVASACPCTSVCVVMYVIVYISMIVQVLFTKKEISISVSVSNQYYAETPLSQMATFQGAQ